MGYGRERDIGPLPSWLTVKSVDELGIETARKAVDTARFWMRAYPECRRRIEIRPTPEEFLAQMQQGNFVVVEASQPGVLTVPPHQDPTRGVLHGMTHATKPDKPFVLPRPMAFQDGFITGYHGLTVLITLHSGEEVRFTPFEEGMAEKNAADCHPGYFIRDPRYFAVGQLTRQLFPPDRFR